MREQLRQKSSEAENVRDHLVRFLRHRHAVQARETPEHKRHAHQQHAGQEGSGGSGDHHLHLLHSQLLPQELHQQPGRPDQQQQVSLRLLHQPEGDPEHQHRHHEQGEQVPRPGVQRGRRCAAAEARLPDQLHPLQDGAMPALRGERRLQVRREVPVRPRLPRAAEPLPPPQVQDRAVPHLPHHRLLPLRPPLPLHPQRRRAQARPGQRQRAGGVEGRRLRAAGGGAAAQAPPQPELLRLLQPARPGGGQPHVPHPAAAQLLRRLLLRGRTLPKLPGRGRQRLPLRRPRPEGPAGPARRAHPQRALLRRVPALAALPRRPPAGPAAPVRVAGVRLAAQPARLLLRPGELRERLAQLLRQPERLRVAEPGRRQAAANLQQAVDFRRLRCRHLVVFL